MCRLTNEPPSKSIIVGSVQGFLFPPRSSTKRPQTTESDRKIAPRKSTRHILSKWDCFEQWASFEILSLQCTRASATNVGGTCPRKDLRGKLVNSSMLSQQTNSLPSPANVVCQISSYRTTHHSASRRSNIHVAPPGCYISQWDEVGWT
jgi:hypothetical protein